MQDAKILSQKDILRLQKATARLSAIVGSLGNGGATGSPGGKGVRRRRKKRVPAETAGTPD